MGDLVGSAIILLESNLFAAWLLSLVIKGVVLLLAAELVLRLVSKSSASIRHLVRSLALVGLLLLPLLSLTLPSLDLDLMEEPAATPLPVLFLADQAAAEIAQPETSIVLPPAESAGPQQLGAAVSETVPTPAPVGSNHSRTPVTPLQGSSFALVSLVTLLAGWAAVALLLLTRLVINCLCVWWTSRRSRVVTDSLWLDLAAGAAESLALDRPVELRFSDRLEVAVSAGFWNPRVLLPSVANTWSLARRRSILLHELAHAKRRDNVTNLVTQLACCLYWFNPVVWWTARQLLIDRERACDDEVLAAGALPSEYAGHLLAIARAVSRRRFWGPMEISQSSALKDRFQALLNARMERHIPRSEGVLGAVVITALVLSPLAALRPWTDPRPTAAGSPRQAAFVQDILPENLFIAIDQPLPMSLTGSPSVDHSEGRKPSRGTARPGNTELFVQTDPDSPETWDRKSWPVTRIIRAGRASTPQQAALWASGPPHLFYGVPSAGTNEPSGSRLPGFSQPGSPLSVPRGLEPQPQPAPGGNVSEPPRQPIVRASVSRTDLGTLGGLESKAIDINDGGLVVGQSRTLTGLVRPFSWTVEEGIQDLATELAVHSRALQVNEQGQILCETFDSAIFRGFLWMPDVGLVDLGAFSNRSPLTVPQAVNQQGHVVGGSRSATGLLKAFLWTPQEGLLDLGTTGWSEALAVNDQDAVVGYDDGKAFLWDRQDGYQVIAPEGSSFSIATALNNRGEVVGYADFDGGYPQAFVWTREAGATPLGRLSEELPISFALGINEAGHVIGRSLSIPDEGEQTIHIFRWTAEGGLSDVGPAPAAESDLAINAVGQIIGAYSDGSEETESSLALLWTTEGTFSVNLDPAEGGTTASEIAAANNKNQFVGSSLNDTQRRASLWTLTIEREN